MQCYYRFFNKTGLRELDNVHNSRMRTVTPLKGKCDMYSDVDLVVCLGDINEHVCRHIDGFDGVHGAYGTGQSNIDGRMLFEFCLENELCVSNTWFKREEKRMVTFRLRENETEIYFKLLGKEH